MHVPFHKQRLDFTCGPACLIMAMRAHDPSMPESVDEEVAIWRSATYGVVPATTRHGLALAACPRGFRARVLSSHDGIPFAERIRKNTPHFYEGALDTLWDDIVRRFERAGLRHEVKDIRVGDVDAALDAGDVPIVLTSTLHFDDPEDIPHWVVVSRRDADGRYHVLNPLDEGPREVTFDRDALQRALGFGGLVEIVLVGPRERAPQP